MESTLPKSKERCKSELLMVLILYTNSANGL